MQESGVAQQFTELDSRQTSEDYNFQHFGTKILIEDAKKTWEARGISPGEFAPDFELDQVGGGSLRLSDLRGGPVLLHFGSFT